MAKSIIIAGLIVSWSVTFTSCSNPIEDIAHELVYGIGDQLLNPNHNMEQKDKEKQQQERFDNLVNWNIDGEVDQEAINKFGYDNCFQITEIPNTDDECQVRFLKYNSTAEGQISHIGGLLCDKRIASDLVYIFRELYEAKCMVVRAYTLQMEQQQGPGIVVNCENPLSADDLAVRLFKEKGFTWGGDQADGDPNCFSKIYSQEILR